MLFQITSRGDEGIACIQLLLRIIISIRHCNLTPLELQPAKQYLRRYGAGRRLANLRKQQHILWLECLLVYLLFNSDMMDSLPACAAPVF
jgi:hypothetical protein